MYDDAEEGIVLPDATPQDGVETIDWDAVLRDFSWVQASLQDGEDDPQEIAFLQRIAWSDMPPPLHLV